MNKLLIKNNNNYNDISSLFKHNKKQLINRCDNDKYNRLFINNL